MNQYNTPTPELVEAAHREGYRVHHPPTVLTDGARLILIAGPGPIAEGWRADLQTATSIHWITDPGTATVDDYRQALAAATSPPNLVAV